ncbi:MAG: deoxyguanosinetriphosphate triphosphohydrolase [Anaerolineaceae bacterium]|nr:deoxyguanosinetriphosphate triphosphohydrolase [Anaerolineaceae bacterium]
MLIKRSQLEEWEDEKLAPYASKSSASRGRTYPEAESEYRTCYQRDRDRILHATAFRRLEYKTQVFINYEGDHYRTRLTHTLEVSQIARSIASALGANQDLTEAICLVHDIGHPPFGHSGEHALNQLMEHYGGFEHNLQSFRVVTELENRYQSFPGLNLTYETLDGIVKHETDYDHFSGLGFDTGLRGNIEAQITDQADALAYTAHDLDDGLRSGMITPNMLKGIELWDMITAKQNVQHTPVIADVTRHELIRLLIGLEVNALLAQTHQTLESNNIQSVDDLQRLSYNVVGFDKDFLRRNRELKQFLFDNLYRHFRVMRMTVKAERILSDLFLAYQTDPTILPAHIIQRFDTTGKERTICDYIAGMTDRFAIDEHQKIFNPAVMP